MHMRKGFTIVELLAVVVVLSILATIVAISYSGWQQRLATNEAKADLLSAKSYMESSRNTSASGLYPASVSITSSPKITITGGGTSANTHYCIKAQSTRIASVVYYITDTTEASTTLCTYP
ncbi:prepilin-type N-terminal cleavage/methylation domain-containing protein [Candidatus Saccharibacteria bacterium]|nr:prepilin-type N-terminal cleavage/methylation domain-containing protein [Candidatus Saccharibacteria bacterium]